MRKIDIINLGCSKNLVDAEFLYTQLKANGVAVRLNPENASGDVIIVNTCGFIGDAKEESIEAILEAVAKKNINPNTKVVVMGCLSERYKSELELEIPEVEKFYGVNDLKSIITDLGYKFEHEKVLSRMHSTLSHYAYLKIAEGCDRACAFCAIPHIRGRQISKPVNDLIEEARFLSDQGVKELILISQELTRYGIDIYKKPELVRLIKQLNKISGIEWIRLHYTYPNQFNEDLINVIADSEKVCNYLDMPFQHFNDRILTMMKRGHSKKDSLLLIDQIRKAIPDIALRTTLLVGHPGEDEAAYNELFSVVQDLRFDRMGVFTYSHEENTFAFDNYQDKISTKIKQERADRLMQLQQGISLEINEAKINTKQKVLIDKLEGEYYVGRTEYDSPEIDNEVLIKEDNVPLEIGSFIEVKITEAREFDLFGKICS